MRDDTGGENQECNLVLHLNRVGRSGLVTKKGLSEHVISKSSSTNAKSKRHTLKKQMQSEQQEKQYDLKSSNKN